MRPGLKPLLYSSLEKRLLIGGRRMINEQILTATQQKKPGNNQKAGHDPAAAADQNPFPVSTPAPRLSLL